MLSPKISYTTKNALMGDFYTKYFIYFIPSFLIIRVLGILSNFYRSTRKTTKDTLDIPINYLAEYMTIDDLCCLGRSIYPLIRRTSTIVTSVPYKLSSF